MSSSSRSCAPSDARPRGARARRAFPAIALLLALAAALPARAADAVEERWYQLSLGGQRCGWMHQRLERSGDVFRSITETEMNVGRMGQGVSLRNQSTFEETARGEPLRAEIRKNSGATPVTSTWTFTKAGIDIVEEQGGRRTSQHRPAPPAGWLPPHAADEFVRHRLASGAKELRYVTVDPESGPDPVSVESVLTGTAEGELDGRRVPLTEWSTKTSLIERPTKEFLSADGVLVRSLTDLGVGILESRLGSRAAVTAASGPVEIMARTFIPLSADAHALTGARRAQLAVRAADGRLADLPSAGAQSFLRGGPGTGTLEIDADAGSPASAADQADQRFLRPSVMADGDDPAIREIASVALRGCAALPLARAEALRTATYRHISNKNLASGFATASEAARSRAGDCTEHAVLLCALLRSQGIPARVCSGLLYVRDAGSVRNTYGWHMWTQAIIDGRWVDLDAVLPPNGPRFDASHVLTGLSAADGASLDTDFARIVDLMGNTSLEVRSIDGRPVAAPPSTAPPSAQPPAARPAP